MQKIDGVFKNEAFTTYGIYFKEIIDGCKLNFSKTGYKKIMKKIFRPVWKGIWVGWVGGWDNPRGKRLKMLKLYWFLPECWIALTLFYIPKTINQILYRIYKNFKKIYIKFYIKN